MVRITQMAAALIEYRVLHGLTRKQLADRIGMDCTVLGQIERGAYYYGERKRLAEFLHVPVMDAIAMMQTVTKFERKF